MKQNNHYILDINLKSLLQGALILAGVWIVFLLRDVIVITIVAFIVSSGIILGARLIHKWLKIPYQIGVFFVLSVVFGIAVLLYQLIVPTISNEFTSLVNNLPKLFVDFNLFTGDILDNPNFNLVEYLNSNTGGNVNIGAVTWDIITGLFFTTQNIINTVFYIAFFLAATFYMAIRPKNLDDIINLFFSTKKHKLVSTKINQARYKVGSWLAGQLLISLILAILTYPFLLIIQVPYALQLSVIAAFLNIIPIIGPILSAIPALILALTGGLKIFFATGLFYLVLQQLDGNFMTPLIMRKVTGIHPLIVMLVILLVASLAGALGALIA
ncbi:MAG: AI-2E family transporter, partial [Candidatus Paceibacterota bacterium]